VRVLLPSARPGVLWVLWVLASACAGAGAGAAELSVGPDRRFAHPNDALAAAESGDVILVHPRPGGRPYRRVACFVTVSDLTIRGVAGDDGARIPLDGSGFDYSGIGSTPRAMFQFQPGADDCVVAGFAIGGCHNASHNGAGIRINQADRVTVRDCEIHGNDMGIMSNGSLADRSAADQRIVDCEIHHNGSAEDPGQNHNLYLGGTSVLLRGCDVHHATTGHNLKSRAHLTLVDACRIRDSANRECDFVDGGTATAAEGSHVLLRGCLILKDPECAGNRGVIHFGQDGGGDRNGTLHLRHCTIVTPFVTPVVERSAPGAAVSWRACILHDGGRSPGPQRFDRSRAGADPTTASGERILCASGFLLPDDGNWDRESIRHVPGNLDFPLDGDRRPPRGRFTTVAWNDRGLPEPLRLGGLREFVAPLGSRVRPDRARPAIGALAADSRD